MDIDFVFIIKMLISNKKYIKDVCILCFVIKDKYNIDWLDDDF